MKYILLTLSLFCFSALSAQEGIQFDKSSFGEILAKAKKEKKLIFVDAMASWCGPCKMMDKNVFSQPAVGEYYNATFINAKLDMEKGEGIDFAKKYAVRSYPSYLFLDGDGQLITRNLGYMPVENFLKIGQEAQANKDAGANLKAEFKAGKKDPEFLAKVIQTYANSDYELAKSASEKYFQIKKTAAYTNEEVGFLFYFIKDERDPNYQTYLKDKAEIIKIIPEATYKDFGDQLKMSKISENAVDHSSKTIKEKQFLDQAVPVIGEAAAQKALAQLKLNYYELSGNFAMYEKTALSFYRNADDFQGADLLKAAWMFADKASTVESLKTATIWAEKAVMQQETAENTYILALLYLKTGKKDEARMYAKHSQNIADSQGKDASMAAKLLTEIK